MDRRTRYEAACGIALNAMLDASLREAASRRCFMSSANEDPRSPRRYAGADARGEPVRAVWVISGESPGMIGGGRDDALRVGARGERT